MAFINRTRKSVVVGYVVSYGLARQYADFENVVRSYRRAKVFRLSTTQLKPSVYFVKKPSINHQVDDLLRICRRLKKRISYSHSSLNESESLLRDTAEKLKEGNFKFDHKYYVPIARLAANGLGSITGRGKAFEKNVSEAYKPASRSIEYKAGRRPNMAIKFLINELCLHYEAYFRRWPVLYINPYSYSAEYCGVGYDFILKIALLMYAGEKMPINHRTFGDYLLTEKKRLQSIQ